MSPSMMPDKPLLKLMTAAETEHGSTIAMSQAFRAHCQGRMLKSPGCQATLTFSFKMPVCCNCWWKDIYILHLAHS